MLATLDQACGSDPSGFVTRAACSGATMGTRWSAVFHLMPGRDLEVLQQALQAAVDMVDEQMSPWKPQSVLTKFNRLPVGDWLDLPEDTFAVLSEAITIAERSEGAFNPFVGDLVAAWGFGAASAVPQPGAAVAAEALWRAARPEIEIDPGNRRIRRLQGQHGLDLCGIAKGFGVDRLCEVLQSAGIADHLVSIDGEVRAAGHKPDGSAWTVAIERPSTRTRAPAFAIEMTDLGIATSGSYRHRHVVDGRTLSHTIDPRTARPLSGGVSSVSVLADSCMAADAWATALMVMGKDAGPGFAREHGLSALFATGEDADTRFTGTGDFAEFG